MQNQSNISKLLRKWTKTITTPTYSHAYYSGRRAGKSTLTAKFGIVAAIPTIHTISSTQVERLKKEALLKKKPLGAILYGKQEEQKHYDEEW